MAVTLCNSQDIRRDYAKEIAYIQETRLAWCLITDGETAQTGSPDFSINPVLVWSQKQWFCKNALIRAFQGIAKTLEELARRLVFVFTFTVCADVRDW